MAKNRQPMPVSERAKQFMPFSALTGLGKALELKERELMLTEKREPSEERAQKLNQCLNELEKGNEATVTYFSGGEYLTVSGVVTEMDKTRRRLAVGEVKIAFDDIYDIEIM